MLVLLIKLGWMILTFFGGMAYNASISDSVFSGIPPSVVQFSMTDVGSGGATSVSPVLPSNPTVGNTILSLMRVTNNQPGTLTPATGWTIINPSTTTVLFAYRIVQSGDTSTLPPLINGLTTTSYIACATYEIQNGAVPSSYSFWVGATTDSVPVSPVYNNSLSILMAINSIAVTYSNVSISPSSTIVTDVLNDNAGGSNSLYTFAAHTTLANIQNYTWGLTQSASQGRVYQILIAPSVSNDSINRVYNSTRLKTDVLTTSDSATRATVQATNPTESVLTTDNIPARVATNIRASSETILLTDSAGRVTSNLRVPNETVLTTDVTPVKTATAIRATSETISTVDSSPTRISSFIRSSSDTSTLSDTLKRTTTNLRAFIDTLTTSDNASRIVTNLRAVSDLKYNPVLRQYNTTYYATGSGTRTNTLNGVLTSTPIVGNLMVAYTVTDGFYAAAPPGWVELQINPYPNDLRVFYRTVQSGDGTTYNFATGHDTFGVVCITEMSGVSGPPVVYTQDQEVSSSSTTQVYSNSLAIPSNGGMLFAVNSGAFFGNPTIASSDTLPSGQTAITLVDQYDGYEEYLFLRQITSDPYSATQPFSYTATTTLTNGVGFNIWGGILLFFSAYNTGDSVLRTVTPGRSVSETLPSVSDSLASLATHPRVASETITTSDILSRILGKNPSDYNFGGTDYYRSLVLASQPQVYLRMDSLAASIETNLGTGFDLSHFNASVQSSFNDAWSIGRYITAQQTGLLRNDNDYSILLPGYAGTSADYFVVYSFNYSGFYPYSSVYPSFPFTLEFIIKPTTVDTNLRGIMSGLLSIAYSSTQIWAKSVAGDTALTASFSFIANNIYHIVATMNSSNIVTLFINGSQVASGTLSPPACTQFIIGYDSLSSPNQLIGYFDEFAIYPSSLSAATIARHYNSMTTGYVPIDAVSKLRSVPKISSETLSTSDSVNRTYGSMRSSSDTFTTTDSTNRLATQVRTSSDNLTTSDSIARTYASIRATSDTSSFSDSINRVESQIRALTETLTTSDTTARVYGSIRARNEVLTTSDSTNRVATQLRGFTDALTTSDSTARIYSSIRASSDTLTTSDSTNRIATQTRSFTDTLTTSDSNSRIYQAIRTSSDTSAMSDSINRIVTQSRFTSDTTAISDSVGRTYLPVRGPFDVLTTSDSTSRLATQSRFVTDTSTFSDNINRIYVSVRGLTDTVTTSDSVNRVAANLRSLNDTTSISDSTTRIYHSIRLTSDTSSISDNTSRAAIQARSSSETLTTSDSNTRIYSSVRSTSDTSLYSESTNRLATQARSNSDTLTTSDTASRAYRSVRTGSDTLATSDSTNRLATQVRSSVDTLTTSDSLAKIYASVRTSSDTLITTDSVNRIATNLRSTSDTVTTSDSSASSFTPNSLGVSVWYDALDNSTITQSGGTVSGWNDKSGNGYNATESNVTNQPSYSANAFNSSYPGIVFGATGSTSLTSTFNKLGTPISIFIVGQRSTLATYGANHTLLSPSVYHPYPSLYFRIGNSTEQLIQYGGAYSVSSSGSFYNTTPNLYQAQFDGGQYAFYGLGTSQGSGVSSTVRNFIPNAGMLIGRSVDTGQAFTGPISEILIFNRYLSDSARQMVEGYLAWKWGMQTSLPAGHPYLSAPPTQSNLTRYLATSRLNNDTSTISDSTSRQLVSLRIASDTSTISDIIASQYQSLRSFTDTLTTSDSTTRLQTLARSPNDTFSTTDNIVAGHMFTFNPAETLLGSSSVTRFATNIRSTTDSFTTTDTVNRLANNYARLIETFSTVDTATRTYTSIRTSQDTFTTIDTSARTYTSIRNLTDTFTTLDTPIKQLIGFRNISDTTSLTDTVARTASQARSTTETLSTIDSVLRHASNIRIYTETLTTSDSVNRINTNLRAIIDTLLTSDTVTRVSTSLRAPTENIPTTVNAPLYQRMTVRSNSETTSFSDTANRVFTGNRGSTESITQNVLPDSDMPTNTIIWDNVASMPIVAGAGPGGANAIVYTGTGANATSTRDTRFLPNAVTQDQMLAVSSYVKMNSAPFGTVYFAVYDYATSTPFRIYQVPANTNGRVGFNTIVPSGVTQVYFGYGISIGDTPIPNNNQVVFSQPMLETTANTPNTTYYTGYLLPPDSVYRTFTGARSVFDILTTTDTPYRTFTGARSTFETILGSDTVNRIVSYGRLTSETLTISDTVSRIMAYLRSANDTTTLIDSVIFNLYKVYLTSETLPLTDNANRTFIGSRSTSQTNTLSDFVSRAVSYRTLPSDLLTIAESAATQSSLHITSRDSISVNDSLSRNPIAFFSAINDAVLFVDAIKRITSLHTTATEFFNYADIISKIASYKVNNPDSIQLSDFISTLTNQFRTISQTIPVADAIRTTRQLPASLSDFISIDSNISANINRVTALNDALSYTDALAQLSNLHIALIDNIKVIDQATYTSARTFIQQQFISYLDVLTYTLFSVGSAPVENFPMSDTIAAEFKRVMALNDTITPTDSISLRFSLQRLLEDRIAIVDTIHTIESLNTSLTDAFTFADNLYRNYEYTTTPEEVTQFWDNILAGFVRFGRVIELYPFSDVPTTSFQAYADLVLQPQPTLPGFSGDDTIDQYPTIEVPAASFPSQFELGTPVRWSLNGNSGYGAISEDLFNGAFTITVLSSTDPTQVGRELVVTSGNLTLINER